MGVACCSASCSDCRNGCTSIASCEPNCDAMDAHAQGMGSRSLGWFWNGSDCVSYNGQSCTGSNCEDAFGSQAECEEAFEGCLDP